MLSKTRAVSSMGEGEIAPPQILAFHPQISPAHCTAVRVAPQISFAQIHGLKPAVVNGKNSKI